MPQYATDCDQLQRLALKYMAADFCYLRLKSTSPHNPTAAAAQA